MCSRRPSNRSTLAWPRWLATAVVVAVAASAAVATVDEVAVAVVAATGVSKNLSTRPNVIMDLGLTFK